MPRDPLVVGRRAFPCCGGTARVQYSPVPLDRRCPRCRRRYQIEFAAAPYATTRLGKEVVTLRFVAYERRGVRGRPLPENASGQLGFEF